MNRMGAFVIFDKIIANKLIKRGFPLREIGGKIYNIYYFDDTPELHKALADVKKELDIGF